MKNDWWDDYKIEKDQTNEKVTVSFPYSAQNNKKVFMLHYAAGLSSSNELFALFMALLFELTFMRVRRKYFNTMIVCNIISVSTTVIICFWVLIHHLL